MERRKSEGKEMNAEENERNDENQDVKQAIK